jgi:hypothetical protein
MTAKEKRGLTSASEAAVARTPTNETIRPYKVAIGPPEGRTTDKLALAAVQEFLLS